MGIEDGRVSGMHESTRLITNSTNQSAELIIEPWGMSLVLPPGSSYKVVASSEQEGDIEVVEEEGATTVYAWSGSTAAVYQGEILIQDFPIPVPQSPPGMSMKSILDLVL